MWWWLEIPKMQSTMINNRCLFWAMKILATRERRLQFFQTKRKEHALVHFPKAYFVHKLNANANAYICFSFFLMWKIPERKTKCRKDLNFFTQSDIFDNFFFKIERKTKRHFSISNRKWFQHFKYQQIKSNTWQKFQLTI